MSLFLIGLAEGSRTESAKRASGNSSRVGGEPGGVGSERSNGEEEDEEDDDGENAKVRERREYLKDMLSPHSLWHSGAFWEQALWQCSREQVFACMYVCLFS